MTYKIYDVSAYRYLGEWTFFPGGLNPREIEIQIQEPTTRRVLRRLREKRLLSNEKGRVKVQPCYGGWANLPNGSLLLCYRRTGKPFLCLKPIPTERGYDEFDA